MTKSQTCWLAALVKQRRISPATIQTFKIQSDRNGWQYPVPGFTHPIRWKAFNSNAEPKYLWNWIGPDGEKHRPPEARYYHAPGLFEAIKAADGVLWIASGEPDIWALHSAGVHNALSWFGENAIPPTLATDLLALGVITVHYWPDRDEAGRTALQKLSAALSGTGIMLIAHQLPGEIGSKCDIGHIWQRFDGFGQDFVEWLLDLPLQTVIWTLRNASSDNALGWYGQIAISPRLVSDLLIHGVTSIHCWPDRDEVGQATLEMLTAALSGTNITLIAHQIPGEMNSMGDVGHIRQRFEGFGPDFAEWLLNLPVETIKLPITRIERRYTAGAKDVTPAAHITPTLSPYSNEKLEIERRCRLDIAKRLKPYPNKKNYFYCPLEHGPQGKMFHFNPEPNTPIDGCQGKHHGQLTRWKDLSERLDVNVAQHARDVRNERQPAAAPPSPIPPPQPGQAFLDSIAALQQRGIDVIPITADQKRPPLYKAYAQRPAADQIQQALNEHKTFNLGARGGGPAGFTAIDSEDEATTQAVIDWLDAHDILYYPVVRSASGTGRHIWLRCHNIPGDVTGCRKLGSHIGHGEVRAGPASYVLVPPSQAWSDRGQSTGRYTFEYPLEQFDDLVPVDWDTVIAPLLVPPEALTGNGPTPEDSAGRPELPIPLPYQPDPPPLVGHLLHSIRQAHSGQRIPHPYGAREPYNSRSEAEEAIISTLIVCGWPYAEIQRWFEQNQPGHYADYRNQAYRDNYLETSYRNAILNIINTPERQPILNAYCWAHSNNWSLHSGLTRLVYHHILVTAYKDKRHDPIVPLDQLQAATSGSKTGVHNALTRLVKAGLIERQHDTKSRHPRYLLVLDAEKANYSQHGGVYTKCLMPVLACLQQGSSYLLPYVYLKLSATAQSISDIARQLRASGETVAACLRQLEQQGVARQVHRYGWVLDEAELTALPTDNVEQVESMAQFHTGATAISVLRALQQACGNIRDLCGPVPEPEPDPVRAYVRIMRECYGQPLAPSSVSLDNQRRLGELVPQLERRYLIGEIDSPSPYRYIRWVARSYRRKAAELGWPLVWVKVLTSPKVMEYYARTHRPLLELSPSVNLLAHSP